MSKQLQTKVKLRRDTSTNWTTNNPTLAAGEIGIDSTNNTLKMGNGSAAWSALPFLNHMKVSESIDLDTNEVTYDIEFL